MAQSEGSLRVVQLGQAATLPGSPGLRISNLKPGRDLLGLDLLKPKIAEICGLGTKSADLFLAF